MQKNHISQDKQQVNRGTAFPFTDAGAGEMRFDMQHGKQFIDPQRQAGVKILQGRFDLPLKASGFPVMQEQAPFVWFLLMVS